LTKERAAHAGAWSALDIILRQGVQFVVSIILARLLAPEDFGLIALLTFFTSLSITFVQGGLSLALVQKRNTTREEESAVFWFNLLASLIFAAGMVAIASPVAQFYGQPLLRPLMAVAAFQVVLSALGAVQTALLTRTLRFDQLTKTGIVSSLVSGGVGVGAAFAGWGVWALAAQMLSAAGVSVAALWLVSEWRPVWHMRISSLRGLASFGVNISFSSILEVIYANGFLLVIGKVYGMRDLGIWNRATGVTSLPTNVISQIIARTALPLFAERASEPDALLRGFRLAIGLSMLMSLPLMIGLCLLSDLVILALFGSKWIEAAPILSITALSGALIPLQVLNLNLLLATGDSKRFLRLEIWKKVFGILIVGTGCFFGIIGVAYAALVISIVALVINARPTGEVISYGLLKQLKDLTGIFCAAAAMAVSVWGLREALDLPPWPALAALTAVGGVVYFGTGALFRIQSFIDAFSLGKALAVKVLKRKVEARPA
jgi:O-antigen/teichoic acid export membrane protein